MVPIRLQQLPRFIAEAARRRRVLARPLARRPTFHLCFFSCQSYFRYLYCSLDSLRRHAVAQDLRVLVFSDDEQPLSAAQVGALQALMPGTRVIDWPKGMGWGAAQIASIWRAYALAASGAADDDYVARVDSDVFFFNDRAFDLVARSGADLVGDGHYVRFQYTQGGCYFVRAGAVRRIVEMLASEPMDSVLAERNVRVEDIAVHHFARRLGMSIWLTWFMMFPDELRRAGRLSAWQRSKFSCLHFVMKNKAAMLDAYEKEVLAGQVPEPFRRALDTA